MNGAKMFLVEFRTKNISLPLIQNSKKGFFLIAVLALYVADLFQDTKVDDPDQMGSLLFHTFLCTSYFMSLFGGWTADACLGKYRTIMVMLLINLIGLVFLVFSSLSSVPSQESNSRL